MYQFINHMILQIIQHIRESHQKQHTVYNMRPLTNFFGKEMIHAKNIWN